MGKEYMKDTHCWWGTQWRVSLLRTRGELSDWAWRRRRRYCQVSEGAQRVDSEVLARKEK